MKSDLGGLRHPPVWGCTGKAERFAGGNVRVTGIGHLFFATGFLAIGAIGLFAHDFVLFQEPVPKDLPWRETLAYLNGGLLLLTGAGLLFRPTAKISAIALTAFLLLWVVVLQIPRAAMHPQVEVYWLGVGEDTTAAMGGWIIFCSIAGRNDKSIRAARILFGLALIPIGLSHFFYLKSAADLIPAWMPFRAPLTELGGAAHIAAGLAIAIGFVPRLAATLEAIMESLFTLIVWVPSVIATPTSLQDWANVFISTALSAAAWAVAESLRKEPWGLARRGTVVS